MKQNTLFEILKAAHMSPSADNSQPWIFEVKKNHIKIHHDLARTHTSDLYNIVSI